MVKKIIFALLFIFVVHPEALPSQARQSVRIAILADAASVSLRVRGSYEVADLDTNRIIHKGKNIAICFLKAPAEKIIIDGIDAQSRRVKITLVSKGLIFINGRSFREQVNIIRKDNGKLLVANELNLDDYVKGVLPHEVAPWWPMEALKAQGVVARTYALYHLQFTKQKDFDLTSDIYSQVYGGYISERWRTNRAVDQTRGEVLTWQKALLPAYYHATCGGRTEDASNLWNIDILPLKGVTCGFCGRSPHFRWRTDMLLADISRKLRDKGFKTGEITAIEIKKRGSMGRVSELWLKSTEIEMPISAKDFRQVLGPNIIKSTNFNLVVVDAVAYIEGLGWGHAVGLCQWGAYFMAKKNFTYEQILGYYYPGAQIVSE